MRLGCIFHDFVLMSFVSKDAGNPGVGRSQG